MTETSTKVPNPAAPTSDAPLGAAAEEAGPPTFDVLPLSPELKQTLAEIGYTHPTPVQIAVWEPATRGRDAVVQARTGTGKTASFGLPIVDHIVKRATFAVQVLILCPTRELALQISGELGRLAKRKETKVLAIYGGAPIERQVQGINDGAQVVVGTPGRVLDHIRRGTLKTGSIKLLVLDESDEMLSMGFERELTAILESLPPSRQTLLFSATVPPDIDRMAKRRLKNPEFITLSGDHIGALSIDHFVYMVAGDKPGALARIIEVENPESAVVFCNTKEQTEAVAQNLQQRGYDADWLNGDLPQGEREKVMSATREGRLRFLVATDVAARGIDISHLTHVINYDFPQVAEGYVHRTGRTGRAGRTGTAISLITPQDIGGLYILRLTYKIRPVERQIPTAGELKTRADADLLSMLAEGYLAKSVHPEDLALARRLLSHDQAETIIGGLLRDALGARPNAQEEASSARRAQVRRGSMRGRRDTGAGPGEGRDGRRFERGAERGDDRQRGPRPVPGREPEVGSTSAASAVGAAPSAVAPAAVSPALASAVVTPPAQAPAPVALAAVPQAPLAGRDELRPPAPPAADAQAARPAGRSAEPRRRRGGASDDRGPRGMPVTEFANWEPLAEEGDDEPLLDPRARDIDSARSEGGRSEGRADAASGRNQGRGFGQAPGSARAGRADGRTDRDRSADRSSADRSSADRSGADRSGADRSGADRSGADRIGADRIGADRGGAERPSGERVAAPGEALDDDYTELFITVGRRDGVRANDLLRALVETAGIDKDTVRRIRVRDRHAFVGVRKTDADAAIAKLHGTTLAGKTVAVEIARGKVEGEEREGAKAEGQS